MREKVAEEEFDIVVIDDHDSPAGAAIYFRKIDEYGFLHHHLPPYNWELAEI